VGRRGSVSRAFSFGGCLVSVRSYSVIAVEVVDEDPELPELPDPSFGQ